MFYPLKLKSHCSMDDRFWPDSSLYRKLRNKVLLMFGEICY